LDNYTIVVGECIVDASGVGELLIADVFSRGAVSVVMAIVARYHGSVRLVTSRQYGSRDVSLVSPAARTAKWALVECFLAILAVGEPVPVFANLDFRGLS
jgi:hypothetical protein